MIIFINNYQLFFLININYFFRHFIIIVIIDFIIFRLLLKEIKFLLYFETMKYRRSFTFFKKVKICKKILVVEKSL